MTEKIIVEWDMDDAKTAHIAQLQDALTRRNKEIERLWAQLEPGAMDSEHYKKGFRDGWKQHYYATMGAVNTAKQSLDALRRASVDQHLVGEGSNFGAAD